MRPVVRREFKILSSVNNLVMIHNLLLQLKPRRTLEVGVCFGDSCLTVIASHRDLACPPQQQHVALNPFQKAVWDDTGLSAVEQGGLSGWLDFRPDFSCLELPARPAQQRSAAVRCRPPAAMAVA